MQRKARCISLDEHNKDTTTYFTKQEHVKRGNTQLYTEEFALFEMKRYLLLLRPDLEGLVPTHCQN